MENTELAPVIEAGEIRMARHPETVLAEAVLCAKALKRVVSQTKAVSVFGGREHLHFTAWQTLATMFRLTPRVRETRFVDLGGVQGYEAFAECYHIPSGQIVSMGEGMCLNDEARWSMRPKYAEVNGKRQQVGEERVPLFQLRSMAQTRACAKVLRNVLSWIVVLAGYAPTAAEEMTGNEPEDHETGTGKSQTAGPQRKTGNGTDDVISEAQGRRLYAIFKGGGEDRTEDQYRELLQRFGYEATKDVRRSDYEAVVDAAR